MRNLSASFVGAFLLAFVAASCSANPSTPKPSGGAGEGGQTAGGAGGMGGASTGGMGGSNGVGGGIFIPTDADGDGISDDTEGKNNPGGPLDTDGDGTPDYMDTDSDQDGLGDVLEGTGDTDGDGIPNSKDPINNGTPTPITLTAISTPFSSPIGIDFHEPTKSVVLSANYPSGLPSNIERIDKDGMHFAFSSLSGYTDEVKIATVRSGNMGGFTTGQLFIGNGIDSQLVRVSPDGSVVENPWLVLPGTNGLFRGSMYVDPTGIYGGDLIAVTTGGGVWRITSAAVATQIANLGVHLEGLIIVPNFPARYGKLAGKILAGAEDQGLLHIIDANGLVESIDVGVKVEDIDLVMPNENFFGVNFGTSRLLGAAAADFEHIVGDIILTQETHTATGLYRLLWDGTSIVAQEIPLSPTSAIPGQWEHVTFAGAGIVEIPPIVPK